MIDPHTCVKVKDYLPLVGSTHEEKPLYILCVDLIHENMRSN